jgi:GSCFA family protein
MIPGGGPATVNQVTDDMIGRRRTNAEFSTKAHKKVGKKASKRAGEELGSLAAGPQKASKKAKRSWAEHRWHELDVNLYPVDEELFAHDLPRLIRESLLIGHRPPKGMLTAADTVITLGSCFARHLRKYLAYSGVSAKDFHVPSGLNNTFAILDFVSWCVTGQETGRGFRYDRTDDGEIREWTPEDERVRYLQGFAGAGAFVFTLGLAEVWEDRETGGVFWRGVPEELFRADRHVFRLSTVDENEANLFKIIELVGFVQPAAPIVLTLSPVPLKATFRDISCVSADCVSKSTLRIAIDRVTSRGLANVYYWPSFEIARWIGSALPYSAFGAPDSRHVNLDIVAEILDAFIEAFWTRSAAAELRSRSDLAKRAAFVAASN